MAHISFLLNNEKDTLCLSDSFSPVIKTGMNYFEKAENVITIGVNGQKGIGKSTFCFQLVNALGDLISDKTTLAACRTAFSHSAGYIRHYDAEGLPWILQRASLLQNKQEIEDHFKQVYVPRTVGGVDIIEHTQHAKIPYYDYTWTFEYKNECRQATLELSDRASQSNKVRSFLNEVPHLIL